jgi:ubiquinone/menaquinone biosynthesis C-methylase UbiE
MVERDAVRRGYDELADAYATERSEASREADVLARFLEPLTPSARVLDAGCGQGDPVLRRLRASATAVGVDFSREQLALATENVPDSALVLGDMTDLPIRDGVVDAVTALNSLIHVPADDSQAVVDEFARVLRPGGRVLLSEGREEWSGTEADWLGSGVEMRWSVSGIAAARRHVRNAGFTVVGEWNVADTVAADDDDGDQWVFLAARLDDARSSRSRG